MRFIGRKKTGPLEGPGIVRPAISLSVDISGETAPPMKSVANVSGRHRRRRLDVVTVANQGDRIMTNGDV
jgi:hypothetical protein